MSVVVVTEDRVTGEAIACAFERRGVTATVCEPSGALAATGDVLLIDLTAPQPSVIEWSALAGSSARTVVVGGSPGLLPAGAVIDRWLPDDRSLDELLDAVTNPNTSTATPPIDMGRAKRPVGSLTLREREVVAALLTGDRVQGIAERLQITENTVRTHLQNVFSKLGVNSRAEAAAYALRHGLVDDLLRASA